MDKLNYQKIKQINPMIIFFIHWSKIIKSSLFENYLCIQYPLNALPYIIEVGVLYKIPILLGIKNKINSL